MSEQAELQPNKPSASLLKVTISPDQDELVPAQAELSQLWVMLFVTGYPQIREEQENRDLVFQTCIKVQ